MSDQAAGLELALLAHAHKLAEEYLADAHKRQQQITADSNTQLRAQEERAGLSAKAHAERIYQQRIQAADLELRAGLEHVRWNLVAAVLDALPGRLAELAQDESRYLPVLETWLRAGVRTIERDELVVRVNRRDLERLSRDWPRLLGAVAAGKTVRLSEETLDCTGGVLVAGADGRIRLDNTFEGRMERLDEALQRAVAQVLVPAEGTDGG